MGQKGNLVYGIGINDADYAVYKTENVEGKRKIVWTCPYYRVWNRMLERGYSERLKKKYPAYEDCSVCIDWHKFSNFKLWMQTKDWKGKHLDKDLLVMGNKIYSPATCVFISPALNIMLSTLWSKEDGKLCGAHKRHSSKGYKAVCSDPTGTYKKHIGDFTTEEQAHAAWKERKLEIFDKLIELESDVDVIKGLINLKTRFKEYY